MTRNPFRTIASLSTRLLPTLLVPLLMPLLVPLLSACSSTGVGNPGATTGTLSLAIVGDELDADQPTSDEPTSETGNVSDAGASPETVTPLPRGSLERAVLVLGSVRWLPCDDTAPVITQSGPFIIDLIAGETRPPLPSIDVPEGGLCGFEAPLAPARGSAEILGRSLWFSGTRADGVRFVLFADMRATLRLRAARGQAWGGDGERALLWAMRPRRWAAARELDDAETTASDGRRTVVIDADRHPLLFALIRARLASQSALFFDRDGNGALDPSDRSEGDVGTGTTDPED
ncbi:MAG: hypothetical protein RL033_3275 [Pseudomonadota bacterium]